MHKMKFMKSLSKVNIIDFKMTKKKTKKNLNLNLNIDPQKNAKNIILDDNKENLLTINTSKINFNGIGFDKFKKMERSISTKKLFQSFRNKIQKKAKKSEIKKGVIKNKNTFKARKFNTSIAPFVQNVKSKINASNEIINSNFQNGKSDKEIRTELKSVCESLKILSEKIDCMFDNNLTNNFQTPKLPIVNNIHSCTQIKHYSTGTRRNLPRMGLTNFKIPFKIN
ncbi:hypothetical protein A3Q56_06792 [Intoshia linei]|uniref:Uncharacterized protein n=1 Tax=Intoshia linei TaxID=1819745 RepID=A0A177AU07_9BILA|nr:hypothetical protein A3Q56_06792 [Intoshia linei]